MKNTTTKTKLTKQQFYLAEIRRNLWSISWMVAFCILFSMRAPFTDDRWAWMTLVGIIIGLLIAFAKACAFRYQMVSEGEKHLDGLRKVFDDMRSLGKRAQWMNEHVIGALEWNYDEQRAEVAGKTDDGELQVLLFVEVVDDEACFEEDIMGARMGDKCPVIVYQVPNDERMRADRTKWMRVGGGATMMQGINVANTRLNEALTDLYNLKGEGDGAEA